MIVNVFIEGLIYAVVLAVIITLSQLYNARLWLNCYPKAIQKVVPERTKKELAIKIIIGIPFLLIMFGYPIWSTIELKKEMAEQFSFLIGFINLMVIQNLFNLFDLLILDWLVFCSIKPRYLVLEGTDGMKEYSDYIFHLKAAFKGLILSIVFSLIVACILLI